MVCGGHACSLLLVLIAGAFSNAVVGQSVGDKAKLNSLQLFEAHDWTGRRYRERWTLFVSEPASDLPQGIGGRSGRQIDEPAVGLLLIPGLAMAWRLFRRRL